VTRAEIFGGIKSTGVIPALRVSGTETALRAVEAIYLGGINIIEISMSMPHAVEALAAVTKAHGPEILAGAGTVIGTDCVHRAYDAGAQFIVTTGFDPEVVAAAVEYGMAVLAGALTPTEVQMAWASSPDAVKLYPCFASGGPRYVRALRGQYPDIEFVASGGVTLENCAEYIHAGVCAVGVGGEIADYESMVSGNHRLFTERARRFRKAITSARMPPELLSA
jgi:2-dehydro-3-deoxyphosphogluconate aldolase/(4S)-4-hydroxy-2-oxoglutarate aldolase